MPQLLFAKPGTRFRLAEMPEVTGVLIKATESRALVRLDRPAEEVEFVDDEGRERRFQPRRTRETSWASTTFVEAIGFETLKPEEKRMSKSAAKKSKTTKAARQPKAPREKKARAPKPDGKLSCLDAAAKVLGEKKEPMTTAEMIELMAAKGYWKSPGGKTPAATLYSAILRELKKGKESRFTKSDRGKFALSGNA